MRTRIAKKKLCLTCETVRYLDQNDLERVAGGNVSDMTHCAASICIGVCNTNLTCP